MNFKQALLTLLGLFTLLSFSMIGLGLGPHSALMLSLALLCVISQILGISWDEIESGMREGISQGAGALMILGMIGMTIATWNLSGTLPTLLSYGLDFFTPRWFLVSSLLLCILVSSFTGSSLTTCATIGTALMGVGQGLGVELPVLAGAIISGAFFGDKMSPLSDTTNFAPGVVGVNLYDHIKSLTATTTPALLLSLLFFAYMGQDSGTVDLAKLKAMQSALHSHFQISLLTLIPAVLVLYFAIRRKPVLLTLSWGIITSFVITALIQKNLDLIQWFESLYKGLKLPIQQKEIAWIINRGGLQSMFFTISLVVIALMFGGVLQSSGLVKALQRGIASLSFKKTGLSILTTFTAILVNLLTGEQYLSLLIPGQVFKESFEQTNTPKIYLTRSLEDGGTLINPLIPWGVCGTFISSQLGVAVLDYLPYACFLYLCPLFTVIFAFGKK